jgi:arsenite-transporting ATPase
VPGPAPLIAPALAGLLDARLVIVAGKGGVGKTTVTAVTAKGAAEAGLRVLVVELDGKPALARLVPELDVRHLSAADALEEYLFDHGFRRLAKRLAASGVIDVVSTAAPGIDDLVVLGKIKQFERSGEWDIVVVDGPAAGHAVTFLTSPAGLRDAVRSGPVRTQADEVIELLGDPARTQVVLVTTPEATPVNELLETVELITRRTEARLGPIVVNQLDPSHADPLPDPGHVSFGRALAQVDDAVAAARFRRSRATAQAAELIRVDALGMPRVALPALPVAGLGPDDVATLLAALLGLATEAAP